MHGCLQLAVEKKGFIWKDMVYHDLDWETLGENGFLFFQRRFIRGANFARPTMPTEIICTR